MSDTTGHSVHSIIGREREIASVSRAVHESAEGRPRFIAIGGAPGIGKTTLAEKACDIADDAGAIIWDRQ